MSLEVLKESLGIDVSKDRLSFCLGILQSDLSKRYRVSSDVENNNDGFKHLNMWIRKHKSLKALPSVVMESTGVYHEAIAQYLHGQGYAVSVLQSGRVKRYSQSLDQRSKTDALDSRMLSMLGCERELTIWEPPSDQMQKLRSLSRERSCLIKERSIELNRAHALNRSVYKDEKATKRHHSRMKLLNDQIQEIELEMQSEIKSDVILKDKISYLKSIPGVSFKDKRGPSGCSSAITHWRRVGVVSKSPKERRVVGSKAGKASSQMLISTHAPPTSAPNPARV